MTSAGWVTSSILQHHLQTIRLAALVKRWLLNKGIVKGVWLAGKNGLDSPAVANGKREMVVEVERPFLAACLEAQAFAVGGYDVNIPKKPQKIVT